MFLSFFGTSFDQLIYIPLVKMYWYKIHVLKNKHLYFHKMFVHKHNIAVPRKYPHVIKCFNNNTSWALFQGIPWHLQLKTMNLTYKFFFFKLNLLSFFCITMCYSLFIILLILDSYPENHILQF